MEEVGVIINGIGKMLKVMGKVLLYVIWGLARISETILHEMNALLKRFLENAKQ